MTAEAAALLHGSRNGQRARRRYRRSLGLRVGGRLVRLLEHLAHRPAEVHLIREVNAQLPCQPRGPGAHLDELVERQQLLLVVVVIAGAIVASALDGE